MTEAHEHPEGHEQHRGPGGEQQAATLLGPAIDGIGVVAGYVVTAPTRLPIVRTLLKESIKVGLRVNRGVQWFAAEQNRQWHKLLEEAQAEAAASAREQEPEAEADDLTSIDGVSGEEARLLKSAGIHSRRQLAEQHNPDRLHQTLRDVNERESIVGEVPSVERIQTWLDRL
jgi:hypothetical protein